MRMLATTLSALALVVIAATEAWAHGQKMKTEPADGASVAAVETAVLYFDQPVRLTSVTLTEAGGGEVDLERTRSLDPEARKSVPLPELAPGAYRLEWRALSQDGHPIEGGFGFTVQP